MNEIKEYIAAVLLVLVLIVILMVGGVFVTAVFLNMAIALTLAIIVDIVLGIVGWVRDKIGL